MTFKTKIVFDGNLQTAEINCGVPKSELKKDDIVVIKKLGDSGKYRIPCKVVENKRDLSGTNKVGDVVLVLKRLDRPALKN